MDIRKSYVIDAPAAAVWAALTEPKIIERWGGGPAVMAAKPGFEFSLWGGDIHGTVIAVAPGRSMLQEWFGGDWDAPSTALFSLTSNPHGGTRLDLENKNVPADDGADIDAGWDDYYLGPIKALLENDRVGAKHR
jgi:activator of HSP90 ATPase